MSKDFDGILDECIDHINGGEAMEVCLLRYPEHAKQLEPLLRAMSQTKMAYSFSPAMDSKGAAKQRFYAALDRQRQPSFWQKVSARRVAWTALATVLVISIAGYLALRTTVFEGQLPLTTISGPSADGNFVFLVSDEVNGIADFSSLNVTIEKVELYQTGNATHRVEFTPEVKEFDLTLLPGEKTQELWRGNVPEGEYSKVVIYVSRVYGVLKATGGIVNIKLPSNKLQISEAFQVTSGNVTSFTYDLTVVKTGNARNGGKYILKPQAGESGTIQEPAAGNGKIKVNHGK